MSERRRCGIIGTEFTSNAVLGWTQKAGVARHVIAPCKPMQNGICETFNARPRPRRHCPMGRRLQPVPPAFGTRLPHPGLRVRDVIGHRGDEGPQAVKTPDVTMIAHPDIPHGWLRRQIQPA